MSARPRYRRDEHADAPLDVELLEVGRDLGAGERFIEHDGHARPFADRVEELGRFHLVRFTERRPDSKRISGGVAALAAAASASAAAVSQRLMRALSLAARGASDNDASRETDPGSAARVPRMIVACLDLEGVLVPEIWINVAERTGIAELRRTTRDEPDYDKLMRGRLAILDQHGLGLPTSRR